jgi:L-2-hydroxyglutarate oxidase LhgO
VESIDVLVVGAGVSGLASALAVALRGQSVCAIDRHPRPGLDTSTHNSGVIHAGIYYPPGSLKARLSVDGRRRMYEFCARHAVAHARCGKLIVALDAEELAPLGALYERGIGNGVEGLALVDATFVKEREPDVRAVAAIHSRETGIVDAEQLVRALLRAGQEAGVVFLPSTRISGAEPSADGSMQIR